MFDIRRITLFCLEKRLSNHKMIVCSKNLGGHGFFGPLSTPMPKIKELKLDDSEGWYKYLGELTKEDIVKMILIWTCEQKCICNSL